MSLTSLVPEHSQEQNPMPTEDPQQVCSHRCWDLLPGRWDNSNPEKTPRVCTVRASQPAHLPRCSASFAPVGIACITAGFDTVPCHHRVTSCSRFLKLPSLNAPLLQKQRQHHRALILSISAVLLCLQVAKIHILFTSTFLMWGNLNLITKARKS